MNLIGMWREAESFLRDRSVMVGERSLSRPVSLSFRSSSIKKRRGALWSFWVGKVSVKLVEVKK